MPWKKGQSGNPGGRPKGFKEIQELAQKYAPTAIRGLAKIAKDGESESARVSAWNALLDRAWGKPVQAHQHTGADGGPIEHRNLTELSDDEIAILERIFGAFADSGADQGGEETAH
jgi:Family of unknown function (DUF5681)